MALDTIKKCGTINIQDSGTEKKPEAVFVEWLATKATQKK
jgi:hypothetical protein